LSAQGARQKSAATWTHLVGGGDVAQQGIGTPLVKGALGLPDRVECLYVVESATGSADVTWYAQDDVVPDERVQQLVDEAQDFTYVVTYEGLHPGVGGESLQRR